MNKCEEATCSVHDSCRLSPSLRCHCHDLHLFITTASTCRCFPHSFISTAASLHFEVTTNGPAASPLSPSAHHHPTMVLPLPCIGIPSIKGADRPSDLLGGKEGGDGLQGQVQFATVCLGEHACPTWVGKTCAMPWDASPPPPPIQEIEGR